MRVRAVTVAALALAAVPSAAGARTAVVRSEVADHADISGVGCGVAASATVPLPATATRITVKRPRVGQTTFESRLTAVTLAGTTVRLTAVGHGRLRCEIPGCVGRGDRFKVVLSRPSRCGDVGHRVYYGRIRFYTTRAYKLIYRIRRGALYSGGNPACASTPVSRA